MDTMKKFEDPIEKAMKGFSLRKAWDQSWAFRLFVFVAPLALIEYFTR